MKRGLPSFIFREIKELESNGIGVDIFTTKYAPGIYMPDDGWCCNWYNPLVVLLLQPIFLIKHNINYIKLFFEAIQTNSLVDFVIAFYYANKMKRVERIHCHEGMHSFHIGYYCSKIIGLPLSVTVHADALWINPNPKLTKKAFQYCTQIITISNYNKKKIMQDYHVNTEKITVIRLGVDTKKFDKKDRKSIMIVGQHAKRKGHDDLLKAFKKLDRDDVDLWIVGSGSWGGNQDYVDVRLLSKKYEVEKNIIYFENIHEEFLQFLYSKCTVFCLPSKRASDGNCEGLPVSIMEAMSSYRPVISTRHTGIPEIVDEKYLVPEGNAVALSMALAELLDRSCAELEHIGIENRKVIEEKFNAMDNTKKLVEFFLNK